MPNRKVCVALLFLATISLILPASFAESDTEEKTENEKVDVDEKKLEYAKGSMCGYCDYCKFCKLCDEDCPCEVSPKQPNCHMCKYCKFCYLCSGLCNTICKPGGYLDTVSAAIVNALPTYNKAEIEDDIDGVKDWIDKVKDEL